MGGVVGESEIKRKVFLLAQDAISVYWFRRPLIRDLVKAGAEVHVLLPDPEASQVPAIKATGARVRFAPVRNTSLNPLGDLRTLWFYWQTFRQERPDVVFSYAAKTNIWGMIAATLAGVPRRVAMVAGMGFAFTPSHNGRRTWKQRIIGIAISTLYRISFRFAHCLIVQNHDDAIELQDRIGVSAKKIQRVNGSGVPLDEWPEQPPYLRPITFTLVARMLREKGVLEFVAAARRIKANYPEVRFVLVGGLHPNPGSIQKEEIESWVREGVVEWAGQVADVRPWLAQTSVFVLPSYREGVPRSTQEAMAMARPVITTDAPGCRETVMDGVNGFLIPPRDVDALVAAVERFIANPNLIRSMGTESRRLAEERFDVRVVNQRLMQILGITS